MPEDKNIMETDNIGKLLLKFSIPAMIGIFVVSLYNIVDSMFVGNYIGTSAIAALTVSAPIPMIIIGIGMLIGVGSSSLLSRSLGAKDYVTAEKTLGSVLFLILTCCTTLSVVALIFLEPILYSFGATEEVINYAIQYSQIILYGLIFIITTMALNSLLRAEGKMKVAMLTMIIGAISNIILDWLFIVCFKFGVRGAAIATLISNIITAGFLLYYLLSNKPSLSLKIKYIRPDLTILKEIFKIGIAAFITTSAMSLMAIVMNHKLANLGGAVAIATYGIMIRVIGIVSTPLIGIAQGMQPIVGFNYGAREYKRLSKSINLSFVSSTICALFCSLAIYLFPHHIIDLFSEDEQLLIAGEEALRMIVFTFPLIGFYMVNRTIFQSLGKAIPNFILSIARQIIFLFPSILILPKFFGLKGMWMAFPVSDLLGSALALIFYLYLRQQINSKISN